MGTLTSSLIVRLINQVSRPAKQITGSLLGIQRVARDSRKLSFGDQLAGAMRRNNSALADARGGLVDAVAGFYTLRTAIASPVRAAMDFESAMADVKKVVNDFDTSTEAGRAAFSKFKTELMEMSKQIPISVSGLAEIAAAAGEAGFAGDELLTITEAAAKISVAFGSTAEVTGGALATMVKSYGLTIDQAVLLSDAMNHLSNKQKSSAPQLLEFFTRIASESQKMNMPYEQAVAFGSAMIAAGHQSDVAATSFRN
ncbi:phage tail tape measure protein, partial [Rhodobacteraceae bacterium (ex Bugula neritina AB1)]